MKGCHISVCLFLLVIIFGVVGARFVPSLIARSVVLPAHSLGEDWPPSRFAWVQTPGQASIPRFLELAGTAAVLWRLDISLAVVLIVVVGIVLLSKWRSSDAMRLLSDMLLVTTVLAVGLGFLVSNNMQYFFSFYTSPAHPIPSGHLSLLSAAVSAVVGVSAYTALLGLAVYYGSQRFCRR